MKVSELVVLVLEALKAAVTPAGTPEAFKLTVPLKPFRSTTPMVLLALPPARRVRARGEDERPKPGAGTVSTMLAGLTSAPEVPVTVTGYDPGVAVASMVKVSEVVLELTVLKAAVTPLGNADNDRLTLPLKPVISVTLISTGPFWPAARVIAFSERARLKPGD